MSAPKPPLQQEGLGLTDPHNVPERFANTLAGIQIRNSFVPLHIWSGTANAFRRPRKRGRAYRGGTHCCSTTVAKTLTAAYANLKTAMALAASPSQSGTLDLRVTLLKQA